MRYPNLKAFQKHLVSAAPHHLCPQYLIQVGDDYERKAALDLVLSYLLTPDSMPTWLNGNTVELRDFFDALQSPSLLGSSVVVLDEVEKLGKKQLEAIGDFLENKSLASTLVLGARSKTTLANVVEKKGVILDTAAEKPWDKEKRLADALVERVKNAGKKMAPDVVPFLFERLQPDAALLNSEIDKLICYVGERSTIVREDVLQISAVQKTHTLWQMAEEIVWEGGEVEDASQFHGLVPALRSQLHLGLVLAELIENRCPPDEWSGYLPKLWPKTLEKRSSQAARLGSAYFRKGMEKLFEIELLSRNNSSQLAALLDLFRAVFIKAKK